MVRIICILLVLVATNVSAQTPVYSKLNGKICANFSDIDGVYVINVKTENATLSDKDGYFSISATVGDTLMFSGVQLKGIRIGLTQKDFEKELFFVKMEPLMIFLKEVIVRKYDNINAVALGIIPKGQKSYTPAERKLKAASEFDGEYGLSTAVSLDPIINFFSGRTAMLKKELDVENKELYMVMLNNMFDENHFVKKLKIPLEYVKGFEYYIVENEKFTTILKTKNKTITEFLMAELAVKYNEIIAREN